MNQPKDYNWCKHCYRNPHKNGHTPFCPATGVKELLTYLGYNVTVEDCY